MNTPKSKATKKRSKTTKQVESAEHLPILLGYDFKTWIQSSKIAKATDLQSGRRGIVFYFARREKKKLQTLLRSQLQPWQMQAMLKSDAEIQHYHGKQGPLWILQPPAPPKFKSHAGLLQKSPYARARDQFGAIASQAASFSLQKLIVEFVGAAIEEEQGALLGLEMAHYNYQELRDEKKTKRKWPALLFKGASASFTRQEIRQTTELARGVNLARHLVNLPGGDLNPKNYTEAVKELFRESSTVSLEIWEGERLKKERMNLMIAVGKASVEGPRLVHLKYRPALSLEQKPIALIGKGITFDSGGLDIKPGSGMRWMKKDMGGSASLVGLAYWAERTQLAQPLDIYLALSENSVDAHAFRPGDVLTARNGLTVEITSTDAEGRLVLADAMTVAIENADKPQAMIDVATLTGAIKVGLGAEIAGLFCNHDELAELIQDSGRSRGELSWRMPLFANYKAQLKSTFADMLNSADGFGGAITAALFLEAFAGEIPWAHLDIYAWRDSAGGGQSEMGGNGQPVQSLAELLSRMAGNQLAPM